MTMPHEPDDRDPNPIDRCTHTCTHEIDRALDYGAAARSHAHSHQLGVIVAAGHTLATYEQCSKRKASTGST